MLFRLRHAALALAVAVGGAFALGIPTQQAHAQQGQQGQQGMPPGAGEQIELSEQHLQAYVAAAPEIQRLSEEWMPRIEAAEGMEEMQELQAEANAEMVQVVEAQGLTVETYNQIVVALRNDPALQEQVMEMMQ